MFTNKSGQCQVKHSEEQAGIDLSIASIEYQPEFSVKYSQQSQPKTKTYLSRLDFETTRI